MKMTQDKIEEDVENIRITFEIDAIRLRINGNVFDGYKSRLNSQLRASMWGIESGFEMLLTFDIGSTILKIKNGDKIEIKENNRFKTYRIGSVEDQTGTIYKVIVISEY